MGDALDEGAAEYGEYLSDELDLYEALVEARPYVFNRTGGDDWRADTARSVLRRVDAALARYRQRIGAGS